MQTFSSYVAAVVVMMVSTNIFARHQVINAIHRAVIVSKAKEVCLLTSTNTPISLLTSLCSSLSYLDSLYCASSSNMSPGHYQALIDRGWRRSGHTYYKPDLSRSCCPHYTIRLDAGHFKASKSQRQAMNRWNRFILGTEYLGKLARLSPRSRAEKRRRKTTFDLEASVHASEYPSLERPLDPRTKQRAEPAHKFEIDLEFDHFSEEKWNVFLAYQMSIHKEPASRCSRESFKRFLCSGLNQTTINSQGVTRKLGSYHQCYRLDGRLIAVAVLDFLPRGVSSVYLL